MASPLRREPPGSGRPVLPVHALGRLFVSVSVVPAKGVVQHEEDNIEKKAKINALVKEKRK